MRSSTVGAARALGLLAAFLTVSLVSGALVAGLFLPAVGATGSLARGSVDYFNSLPAELDEPPLSEQSVILAGDNKTVLAYLYEENRRTVPLSRIAPVMRNAIIAIEDSRFYQHGGVDPKGLMRAFVTNSVNDDTRIQGASTLTQQYIKNVILETAVTKGDKEGAKRAVARDKSRKIKEIRLAIQLEKQKTKDEILEGYLNIANFGSATYGIEAAARFFFDTTAAKLTLVQAATLAGLVQVPGYYDPLKYAKRAKDRRDVVLTRMRDLGYITAAAHKTAVKSKLVLKPRPARSGCIAAKDNMAYFCSYVKRMIEVDPRFAALGKSEAERRNTLLRGGLRIVTTIDPKIQRAAFTSVTKKVPIKDPSRVAAAAVTVEPGTGKVLAMAQNKIYSPKEKLDGHTEINFSVDFQYGGSVGFQTGSTFKPFTLATWLKAGNSLGDLVDSNEESKPYSDFRRCGNERLGGDTYEYSNSEGGKKGSMPVLQATYNSVNTAYVDMEAKLELCKIAATAQSLGVHTAAPYKQDCGGEEQGKLTTKLPDCVPSLTLGPKEVAPLTMAAAYATFAASGTYCPPTPVTRILDRNRKPVPFAQPKCTPGALDQDVAHGVTHALKNTLEIGTARGLDIAWPAAGKTGTTDQSVDTWFVGYTKQRATAVWVGDPTVYKSGRKPLQRRTIGGEYFRNVYGASLAAPIWRGVMQVAQAGQPKKDWPKPPVDMVKGSGVSVPNVKGRSAGEAMGILSSAGFRPRVAATYVDSDVPAGFVAETSPAGGSTAAAGSTVEIRISNGRGAGNGGGGEDDDRADRADRGNRRTPPGRPVPPVIPIP